MCTGEDSLPGSTRSRLTPTFSEPAAVPRSYRFEPSCPCSTRRGSTSSQCAIPTRRLFHDCSERRSARVDGGSRAFVALAARPRLRLADELAQLVEELRRLRIGAFERVDSLESRENGACFVHVPTVA